MYIILRGVAGERDSAIIALIFTMQSGLTRLGTGELPVTLGHRLDGTILGALMTPVDDGIPEADMTLAVHGIRAVDMTLVARLILVVEPAGKIQYTFRIVQTMFTQTSKGTSTVTLRRAGNNIPRTAGQRQLVGHRNLIATKSLESKVKLRRNSAVLAQNAVVAVEEDPDDELVPVASSKSGVGESRNG